MDRTKSRGAMWGLLALVVTIGLLGSALAGGSALAARGGNHAAATRTATLTVSPNPVALGATGVVISGSGFPANRYVYINTGFLPQPAAMADGSGSFSVTYSHTFNMPETAWMYAYVYKGNNLVLRATTSYTVCATTPC